MTDAAQMKLISSTVLILGIRWTGRLVAQHLAETGVGKIFLIDENPKLLADAANAIQNSSAKSRDSEIISRAWSFEANRAEQIVADADVVIDAVDNWQQKLLASDVCMHLRKPLIHAGGSGFRFQIYTMLPGKSACLRCAFPAAGIDDVPLTPSKEGQLGPVVAMRRSNAGGGSDQNYRQTRSEPGQ